jgi:Type IV secretion system pilin
MRRMLKTLMGGAGCAATAAVVVLTAATPAWAQTEPTGDELATVIANATAWIVGILVGLATLFLTIGGALYLMAGGDPGQIEKAKTALKSALIGYALAVLAPVLLAILDGILGG